MESNKESPSKDAQQSPQGKEKRYDKHGNELAELKWPLTRRERIYELDLTCKEYKGTQVENILAAKVWHPLFPLDEYVPRDLVSFQEGKKIDESELKGGLVWSGGAPEEATMTG